MKILQPKDNENFSQNSKSESIVSQTLMDTPLMQQMSLEQDIISNSSLMQQKQQEHNKIFGTIQKKENKTGIPDNLKNGMESLSGINLNSVKVHYNSPKPKTLQAHAFASGNEIHIASGQEKHLAHELGHVVQQAKGEVKPTSSVNGLAINDSPSLENEATQMGEKALQMKQIGEEISINDDSLTNSSSKPIQLISTQITFKEDDKKDEVDMKNEEDDKKKKRVKIEQVIVRGRPKKVFSNSMGDHTTAFIVQIEGLNLRLQNKTLTKAIKAMNKFKGSLKTLDGYKFLSGEIKKRFNKDYSELVKNIAEAKQADNDDLKTQYLQEAINAYLSARELIPFSTINVGEKNKGASGKGHGESSYAKILSSYERAKSPDESGITDNELIEAISGLFDYQSASMLAVEQNEDMITTMTAGISFGEKDVKERLGLIWNQHKLSIEKMFPKSYNKVKASLTEDKIEENIKINIKKDIESMHHEAISEINKAGGVDILGLNKLKNSSLEKITDIYNHEAKIEPILDGLEDLKNIIAKLSLAGGNEIIQFINSLKAQLYQKIEDYKKKYPAKETLYNQFLGKTNTITKITSYEDNKDLVDKNLKDSMDKLKKELQNNIELKKKESGDEVSKEKIKSDKKIEEITKIIKNLEILKQGRPIDKIVIKSTQIESKDEDEDEVKSDGKIETEDKVKSDGNTLSSAMGPMSIQLLLNSDGIIKEMKSDGRPKSPFKGTMGAHSTAWAVHLDRVRAIVKGKDIATATEDIVKLLGVIEDFAETQKNKKLGDNAKAKEEGSEKSLYDNSKSNMLKYKSIKPEESNIATLQNIINAILSFYNLIPDVSRDKIDTGGKGEGGHRQTLLNYEKYGQNSIKQTEEKKLTEEEEAIKARKTIGKAINGLYDGNDRKGTMYNNHLEIIEKVYPHSYELFKKGKLHTPSSITVEKEEESEEFEEDIKILGETEKEKLRDEQKNQNPKWERNNCLINAITDAAGMPRANVETIIKIRTAIGAKAGEMLFSSPKILDEILKEFGLTNIGVIVYYRDASNSKYPDYSSTVGDNSLIIVHNGVNHFTVSDANIIPEIEDEKELDLVNDFQESEDDIMKIIDEKELDLVGSSQESEKETKSKLKRKRLHPEANEEESNFDEDGSYVSSIDEDKLKESEKKRKLKEKKKLKEETHLDKAEKENQKISLALKENSDI